MDMYARYEALMQARRVVVDETGALYRFSCVFSAPPPVVWSWLNDAEKRRRAAGGRSPLEFIPVLRPGGRTSAGAVTHCVHGSKVEMRERVVDWNPFEYFTLEQNIGAMGVVTVTFRLEPGNDDSSTRLDIYLTGSIPGLPDLIGRH